MPIVIKDCPSVSSSLESSLLLSPIKELADITVSPNVVYTAPTLISIEAFCALKAISLSIVAISSLEALIDCLIALASYKLASATSSISAACLALPFRTNPTAFSCSFSASVALKPSLVYSCVTLGNLSAKASNSSDNSGKRLAAFSDTASKCAKAKLVFLVLTLSIERCSYSAFTVAKAFVASNICSL